MQSTDHVLAPLLALGERDPDRIILTFVDERGRDTEVRTAGELVRTALRLAAYLVESCGLQRGDVVLLVYPPSMEFIDAFIACLYAGIIPAPVYPPNPMAPQSDVAVLSAIAAQAGAKAMLTNRSYRWAVRLGAAKNAVSGPPVRWPTLPWYVTQDLRAFVPRVTPPLRTGPGDLALLQFTSGSTSMPRGVRLTHGNLAHQLDFNASTLDMNSDARMVSWVPQYHDLGLISGILSAIRGNGRLFFMSPQSFLANPALWPETIHRVRGTHTASPNFGFDFVTRRTTATERARWDLSSLRVIMSAAEPIMPRTVDAFFEAFAPCNVSREAFCTAYGLAEHTVGVTVWGRGRARVDRETLGRQGLASIDDSGDLELLSCGRPSHGIEVRIVDPTHHTLLPERQVGEIWVQSASVADGYENAPAATQASFGATLEGATGPWLRTGDLGFLHRGELYITGRIKDLIILRGRNMHPEDLEEAVRYCHPDLRPGGVVAFAVSGPATEALVVVAEVKDPKTVDAKSALSAIEKRIREVWRQSATVALARPGTLKKTTSGKLQRSACQKAWQNGQLSLIEVAEPPKEPVALLLDAEAPPLRLQLAAVPSEERLFFLAEAMRKAAAAEILANGTELGVDDFLPELGLDSLAGTRLLSLLEARLEQRLPASLFIEHPTLRSAAARVLEALGLEFTGAPSEVPPEEPLPFRPPHRLMPPATTRVGIVGGGVGGLIAALELARLGYRDIVLFEAAPQCGGKVVTAQAEDAKVELGQIAFGDAFRVVLELATELGIEIKPEEGGINHWDEQHGIEKGPAVGPGVKWMRSLLKAARAELNPPLPLPSLLELDEPFGAFLARHNLRRLHPRFSFLWTAMGYGFDEKTPTCYVIAYLQILAACGHFARLPAGNQSLWLALAEHLENAWGVKVLRHTAVSRVDADDTGVTVEFGGQRERFDEVILAVPPAALKGILPQSDPLQPVLSKFEDYRFRVDSFSGRAHSDLGAIFIPQRTSEPGRVIVLRESSEYAGWYITGQYASSALGHPIAEEAMAADVLSTAHGLGIELKSHGPHRTWDYFPQVRQNSAAVLRSAEALQGRRHLWTTGSWISFETTEHVARHARHLIRTCFDPAAGPPPE